MEKKFLIVTANKYPTGDAGSLRLRCFVSILIELGYVPVVIGMGDSTCFQEKSFEGGSYYSLRYPHSNLFYRILGRLTYDKHLKRQIKRFDPGCFHGILIDSGTARTFRYVKKYAKKHKISLYHDSVEWFSPEEYKTKSLNQEYRLNNAINTKYIDKNYKVIAISSFLEKYFLGRGIETVRIPVMLDVMNTTYIKKTKEDKVVFVYAGAPGRKDFLKTMVGGFSKLDKEELHKFEFRIIGVNEIDLINVCGAAKEDIDYLGASLKCYGRVDRSVVLEHLSDADFTVLMRPADKRYAKAGFPTKFVESLTAATPVISNLTSDLSMYLVDEQNGLIVDECSEESFCAVIKKAITLPLAKRMEMQRNARRSAEENFDYRLYTDLMRVLIE